MVSNHQWSLANTPSEVRARSLKTTSKPVSGIDDINKEILRLAEHIYKRLSYLWTNPSALVVSWTSNSQNVHQNIQR